MAAQRKPKIEFYWSTEKISKEEQADMRAADKAKGITEPVPKSRHVINWRLVGANGEVMCQSTQGFLSRAEARNSVNRCGDLIAGLHEDVRRVGPGVKPS